MKLCGSLGFKSKTGEPCGYRISDHAESCPHHQLGGSQAREFQLRGAMASKFNRLPSRIAAGALDSTEAIRQLYRDVITTAVEQKRIDRSRLEIVLKALSGASALLQVDATRELTDILLQLDGQGKALLVLNSLKQARRHPLPPPAGQEVHHAPK